MCIKVAGVSRSILGTADLSLWCHTCWYLTSGTAFCSPLLWAMDWRLCTPKPVLHTTSSNCCGTSLAATPLCPALLRPSASLLLPDCASCKVLLCQPSMGARSAGSLSLLWSACATAESGDAALMVPSRCALNEAQELWGDSWRVVADAPP